MAWEVVIGLETHVQLKTQSKMFSRTPAAFESQQNRNINPVDVALPGVLPVPNLAAIQLAIRFGLAVEARIATHTHFDRKNYVYPDLPKGYQISQYDQPIVAQGRLAFEVLDAAGKLQKKSVDILRAHLEEDAGKLVHDRVPNACGVDFNRAGIALLEVVTQPQMHSAQEAVAYAKALYHLVSYLDICDGNMQEGSFRCDANVSIRQAGETMLGTRCEIKNLNSFRFLEQAIEAEFKRQVNCLSRGESIRQQTRGFDDVAQKTFAMRDKENLDDYRFFPDPDLPPLFVSEDMVAAIKAQMPELPEEKRVRFAHEYGLNDYDLDLIVGSVPLADYYETVLKVLAPLDAAKLVANWLLGEVSALINAHGLQTVLTKVEPQLLAGVIERVQAESLSQASGKKLLRHAVECAAPVEDLDALIEQKGWGQISDTGFLTTAVEQVLAGHQNLVEQYQAGKGKAINALVGKVMQQTKGLANPAQVQALLLEKLG